MHYLGRMLNDQWNKIKHADIASTFVRVHHKTGIAAQRSQHIFVSKGSCMYVCMNHKVGDSNSGKN